MEWHTYMGVIETHKLNIPGDTVIMEFGWEFTNDFLDQKSFFDELIIKNGTCIKKGLVLSTRDLYLN